jgi:hypothetical protein
LWGGNWDEVGLRCNFEGFDQEIFFFVKLTMLEYWGASDLGMFDGSCLDVLVKRGWGVGVDGQV